MKADDYNSENMKITGQQSCLPKPISNPRNHQKEEEWCSKNHTEQKLRLQEK